MPPPCRGVAKIHRGVAKIFGSLRSLSATPLTKTLKPPLLFLFKDLQLKRTGSCRLQYWKRIIITHSFSPPSLSEFLNNLKRGSRAVYVKRFHSMHSIRETFHRQLPLTRKRFQNWKSNNSHSFSLTEFLNDWIDNGRNK